MITEWFISIGTTIATWFANLFPDWTPPAFLVNLGDTINSTVSNLSGVAVWVDWGTEMTIAGVVTAVWISTFGVKIVRALASYIPFVGGSG